MELRSSSAAQVAYRACWKGMVVLGANLRVVNYDISQLKVVAVSGELDMAGAPTVRRRACSVVNRRPAAVIMELSDVSFMDCSGLSALLFVRRRAELLEVPFALSGLASGPAKVLRLTGTTAAFTVYSGLDHALAAHAQAGDGVAVESVCE